jgi:hypothetical protein
MCAVCPINFLLITVIILCWIFESSCVLGNEFFIFVFYVHKGQLARKMGVRGGGGAYVCW